MKTVERFDPREGNKCVQVKEMKESRCYAAAAEHKGMIYVTGGYNGKNVLDTKLEVEMFANYNFFDIFFHL